MLKSDQMKRDTHERSWLPWFGKTGKFAMRWSSFINRRRYPILEQTFEGLATTRKQVLVGWANQQWMLMEAMAEEVRRELPRPTTGLMQSMRARSADFSELVYIDNSGQVIASSHYNKVASYKLRRLQPLRI